MTDTATDEPEVEVLGQGKDGSSTADDLRDPAGEIVVASRSDVGRVRSANEDTCDTFERPDGTHLLVVADGMGGHQGGATASRTAVEAIAGVFHSEISNDPSDMLRDAIQTANHQIFELAQHDPELEGMGTTVVSFLLDSRGQGVVAHVGDSRAYRYRQGQLEPLTVDHSVVAEMRQRGLISADEAAVHPRRNEILRSVGIGAETEVEVAAVEVAPGDRFLLCSDGLSGVLSDDEIAAIVQAESPENAVEKLIQMANDRGGPDNISVQVLSIPASHSDGDPEATAPVELSEVGIQAIETKRNERKRMRLAMFAAIGLSACFVLYLAWQAFAPVPERPIGESSFENSFERSEPAGEATSPTLDKPEIAVDSIDDESATREPHSDGPIGTMQTRLHQDESTANDATGDTLSPSADTAIITEVSGTETTPTPVIQKAEDSYSDDAQQSPRSGVPQARH